MSDRQNPFRPCRGVLWRQLPAGQTFGQPFGGWAYQTSRFPDGISEPELAAAIPGIQIETANAWFQANFKPWTQEQIPTIGGPGREIGVSPYGRSPMLRSADIFDAEFGRIFTEEIRARLIDSYPGVWMFAPISEYTPEPVRQASNGVIRDQLLAAGNQPLGLLAKLAYVTPRYPTGIDADELRRADHDVQRETAFYWFVSNFRPYDLSGGSWFGFGPSNAGFGQGVFAPAPVHSVEILDQEFGSLISAEVLHRVADRLPGDWMRTESVFPAVAHSDAMPPADALREVLVRLEPLLRLLGSLYPEHGEVGHNQIAADLPISKAERDVVVLLLQNARSRSNVTDNSAVSEVNKIWTTAGHVLARFGAWSLDRCNDYFTEMAKSAGKKTGERLSDLVFYGVAIWQLANAISQIAHSLH